MSIWPGLLLILVGYEVIVLAHMLSHLLAAWAFRVPVEFHVGFGPALPGCRSRWGRCTYVLAVFPLGGYVSAAPRAEPAAPVWRRLGVVAGGVLGSLLRAWVCFAAWSLHGRERRAARRPRPALRLGPAPAARRGPPGGGVDGTGATGEHHRLHLGVAARAGDQPHRPAQRRRPGRGRPGRAGGCRVDPGGLWGLLGILGLNFALLNLLPIPVLDGGEVLLLRYEKARGRPLSRAARRVTYAVGLGLLTLLSFLPALLALLADLKSG